MISGGYSSHALRSWEDGAIGTGQPQSHCPDTADKDPDWRAFLENLNCVCESDLTLRCYLLLLPPRA